MSYRKYDTCFFERYAMLQLQSVLGHKFDNLVNKDRPDLQSADGLRLGIDVTRAMEGGRKAALQMLKDISGITGDSEDRLDEIGLIQSSGYGYGLRKGGYIGGLELDYWNCARPMKDIIASKVNKVSSGFYGDFDQFGLFVFSHEPISLGNAYSVVRYILDLQKMLDVRYDRLYLSAVSTFYACNLSDELALDYRIIPIPITEDQRKLLFLSALDYQG